jgi:hypothetical protein
MCETVGYSQPMVSQEISRRHAPTLCVRPVARSLSLLDPALIDPLEIPAWVRLRRQGHRPASVHAR